MDAAPQRPLQDVIKAEADRQLEAGDEAADLRHTEGNWKKFVRSGAPFSALILTRITARKASASIDKVMCRYQPCQPGPRSHRGRLPAWRLRSTLQCASADRQPAPRSAGSCRRDRTPRNTPA